MQMIIHTSAIEQTHGFALSLRCLWMKATDILVGMRQLVTSPVYKLYTDMLFLSRFTPAFRDFFRTNW